MRREAEKKEEEEDEKKELEEKEEIRCMDSYVLFRFGLHSICQCCW